MVISRLEPAGNVIVPDATPFCTEMLNTRDGVMSVAATTTTTVATAVADTLARSASATGDPFPGGSVASLPRQEAAARAHAIPRATGVEGRSGMSYGPAVTVIVASPAAP